MKNNNAPASVKIKSFMKTNWFLLWFFLAITTFVNIFIADYIHSSLATIRQDLKESSKKVVALSVAGQMVYAQKQSIDISSDAFKNALKNVLVGDLIVDSARITQNFTRVPKTQEQIIKSYEPLNTFYKYYLDKKGLQDFVFYIREIGKLVNSQNLVEYITPYKSTITRYTGNTRGFEIEIVTQCALSYFLEEENKNVKGIGAITIEAKGDFNPAKGTVVNPLGIDVSQIKVTLIEKPRNRR